MILITGAGGQVGCAVIAALKKKGLETRALIHNSQMRDRVLTAGAAEVIEADMEKEADLQRAFEGIQAVYHIAPAAHPHEEEIGKLVLKAASADPSIYFVYHSVLHSVLYDLPHHRQKLHMEGHVVESGLSYTIVQPAVFMQMLAPAVSALTGGSVFPQKFFTGPHTQMNLVNLEDAAAAVAEMFASPAYRNATFELCGPQNISLADLTEDLSAVTGKKVESSFISDEAFLKASHAEAESYQGKTLLAMFAHYNAHSFRGNDYILRSILGHTPTDLRTFLKTLWEKAVHPAT